MGNNSRHHVELTPVYLSSWEAQGCPPHVKPPQQQRGCSHHPHFAGEKAEAWGVALGGRAGVGGTWVRAEQTRQVETPTLPAQLAESGRPRCPPLPHPEEVTGSPFDSGEIMWLSKLQADIMAGHRSLGSPCHYSWGGAGRFGARMGRFIV